VQDNVINDDLQLCIVQSHIFKQYRKEVWFYFFFKEISWQIIFWK
jgi:hypothetical protein